MTLLARLTAATAILATTTLSAETVPNPNVAEAKGSLRSSPPRCRASCRPPSRRAARSTPSRSVKTVHLPSRPTCPSAPVGRSAEPASRPAIPPTIRRTLGSEGLGRLRRPPRGRGRRSTDGLCRRSSRPTTQNLSVHEGDPDRGGLSRLPRQRHHAGGRAAIDERYPDDMARGYSLGDVRGAFSLSKPL
jgi:hypothetical protein